MPVAKVNVPLAESVRESAPLFWRTIWVPDGRPEIEPPIVNDWVEQTTDTFETFARRSEPLAFVTAHPCPFGCVVTVTSYDPPAVIPDANVKLPLLETVRVLPPLSLNSMLEPLASPETVPETVNLFGSTALE